ncbi:ABC transporter ATP-binding protein [Oceanispirochaeta sp. M1]|uniref:ABC transporter ATP-binding protein n=1 Tax=unclassified Oceanispirochaeta TaxID=2635722 RepID=UPI001F16E377|nr:ABC transporter ATP-binding protein [Oceanispirochaeta sp. M1]
MSSTANAIEIKDLSFRYKSETAEKNPLALENISMDVKKGEFIVIMGPSGAGKSTLANCLNGLVPHFQRGEYEGEVKVGELIVKNEKVGRMSKEIGLVFQDFEAQLFSTNTMLELAFGPENFGVPREEIHSRITEVLKTVQLEGFEGRQPSTLSGGQKQRLAIGSILATKPEIICMDEPTTDLDPVGKMGIFKIAKHLHSDSEFTLLIIEHETEEALHADRLILMENGVILKDGIPRDILKNIGLTDKIGIQSLQVPKFFNDHLKTDSADLPMTPEEGFTAFQKMGISMNDEAYENLLKADEQREASYGEVLIDVEDLVHVYPNQNKALKGVSLQIRKGEFLAVLGHNGSGKTTLVKHFNGLLSPSEGNIIVGGRNTRESTIFEIGKTVGYVFQNPDHQIFSDTVFEEVSFSPKLRGCSKEEIKIRVTEALKAVGMEGSEEEDPFSMTKGQRQRIAVASVLSAKPELIILDEPTTGLDYKEQRQMMELIQNLNKQGHTIIMITHTMWVVAEYAHRVAVIKDGEMSMYGKTRDVFKDEDTLMESYLKTPHIVNLSNKLGKTILSVDELKSCVRGDLS